MSDDLVKRLRDHIAVSFDDRGHVFEDEVLCDDAAHRTEELEAKLDWMIVKLDWVIAERDETFALMLDRAQTAEAKLAKAVEECACIAESHKPSAALLSDRYWRGVDEAAHSIAYEIYATLAELTGGKDE